MSETTTESTETEQQPAGTESETDQKATPDAEQTDWKAEARKWEARSKENHAAAQRLQEIEDANKSELEKAVARAEKAESELTELSNRTLRTEVALAKGLDPALAARLSGSTKEELEADADSLLELFGSKNEGTPRRPAPDPSRGRSTSSQGSNAEQFAAALDGVL